MDTRRGKQDVEDRRDESSGGRGGFQFGGMHIGIGGAILLLILSYALHLRSITISAGAFAVS
jgi:predicted metalloprotease